MSFSVYGGTNEKLYFDAARFEEDAIFSLYTNDLKGNYVTGELNFNIETSKDETIIIEETNQLTKSNLMYSGPLKRFIDSGLTPGVKYNYTVTAKNDTGSRSHLTINTYTKY